MGKKRPATRRPPVLASNPRARASAANPTSVDARIDPRQLSPSNEPVPPSTGEHDVLEDDPLAGNVGDGVASGEYILVSLKTVSLFYCIVDCCGC